MHLIDGTIGVGALPGNLPAGEQRVCATVQVGESSISQVAQRLGCDPTSLLHANPHLTDPADLKAGQELNLPDLHPAEIIAEGNAAENKPEANLAPSPVGDPLASTVTQARLLVNSGDAAHAAPAGQLAE